MWEQTLVMTRLKGQAETRTAVGSVVLLPMAHPHSETGEQIPLPDVVPGSIREHRQHQEASLALVWALAPQSLFQHGHLGEQMALS